MLVRFCRGYDMYGVHGVPSACFYSIILSPQGNIYFVS